MVYHIYEKILCSFFRTTLSLRYFEGDKNELVELHNKTTIVAKGKIPGPEKSLLRLI